MKLLITGGAGFIGSHTCLQLLCKGYDLHVIDSLENGLLDTLREVEKLAEKPIGFTKVDIRDEKKLSLVFKEFSPDAVFHFAALKSVVDSFSKPDHYYDVNVKGTSVLLKLMAMSECNKIVFSSSATVYGDPVYLPCDELHPTNPKSPYGQTKLAGEELISKWVTEYDKRKGVVLRYFNPVAADESGRIGENYKGCQNNLMPIISKVVSGLITTVNIYGSDYPTIDGSAVRDYIHVKDLAFAHICALERMTELEPYEIINVGTGHGISVVQLINEFEKQSGQKISSRFSSRRPGDPAKVWADVDKALEKLHWSASKDLGEMCYDTWNWIQNDKSI